MFLEWVRFQWTMGTIKLHLQLVHPGCLLCWACITDGDTKDVRFAQTLTFACGTVVVIDRSHLDYDLYSCWTATGVLFVIRPVLPND